MYANTAYIDKSKDGEKNLSVPLAVTCGGYYKIDTGTMKTERPQGREDFQLLYVAEGTAYFVFNGLKQAVTKGNVILFRPNEPQMYYYHENDIPEVYWVHFTGYGVDGILTCHGIPDKGNVFYIGTSSDCRYLYGRIISEIQLQKERYNEMTELLLTQILITVGRKLADGHSAGNTVTDEIERAVLYFQENYSKPINIEQYASKCHMSTCWFINNFKKATHMTPTQYIVSLRIANAESLIDGTNYSIAEISSAVGYDNALYFSRLFRKHVGCSPTEYRKRSSKQL